MTLYGTTYSLADFLVDRIAEDKAAARLAEEDAIGPHWDHRETRVYVSTAHFDVATCKHNSQLDDGEGGTEYGIAPHIARWHPYRVLAECETKRRLVAEHRPVERLGAQWCRMCVGPDGWPVRTVKGSLWPCRTLRLLAVPYAWHGHYQEEWRP